MTQFTTRVVRACESMKVSFCPFFVVLLSVLFILGITYTVEAADEMPDCHKIEPFCFQTPPATATMVDGSESRSITCRLRFGAAAVALLGSPEERLLSPLRPRARVLAPHIENLENDVIRDSGSPSTFTRAKEFWNRFRTYPWNDVVALERLFFQRQFRLSFMVDAGAGEAVSSNQLLSIAMLGRIRATSFAPKIVQGVRKADKINGSAFLTCDGFDEMLEVYRVLGDVSSVGRIAEVFGMRMLSSFFGGGSRGDATLSKRLTSMKDTDLYLFEELGPQRRSTLWIASWVAAWLGSRPMATTEMVDRRSRGETGVGGSQHNWFFYEATVPVVKPVCLRLAAVQEPGLVIHVEESVVFDIFWLKIILFLVMMRLLQSWVEDIPALQTLVAGLGSVVVLGGFMLFFLLRKLQSMTLGKIGIIAVLTMGGVSALAESLLSAASALLYTYFRLDEESEIFFILTCVLVAVGILCGLLSRFLWASYLSVVTRWTLWGLQLSIFLCAALQNREATLVFVFAATVLRPSLIFYLIMWCSPSHWLENRENDPEESFPISARRAVDYAPPVCVEGRLGGSRELSPEARLYLYDVLGNEYTQQALAHLAKRVKDEPERYASRLKNSNSVVSWAQQYNQTSPTHRKGGQ